MLKLRRLSFSARKSRTVFSRSVTLERVSALKLRRCSLSDQSFALSDLRVVTVFLRVDVDCSKRSKREKRAERSDCIGFGGVWDNDESMVRGRMRGVSIQTLEEEVDKERVRR